MAGSPSAQVVARMGRLAAEVARSEKTAVLEAAKKAKVVHLAELKIASGGDLRMSGVGRSGARVGVRYLPTPVGTVVQATGPVHLLERPSKAHEITPRKRARARRARALATPYGPRARVWHPGVRKPSKPWAKGFLRARPVVTKTIEQQYGAAFTRAMRG